MTQKMMSDTHFEIVFVTAAEVLPLRDRVLRADRPAGASELRCDRNANTLHLGAVVGNELVGVGTIAMEDPPGVGIGDAWRLCGMAVLAGWRGQGIGKALAEKCIDHAKLATGRIVWCSARESAFEFYRRIGFVLVGDLFTRPETIGERYARMECHLADEVNH
ncbi:GNAT family N-acetyltransferase [Paraburkholderia caledonica]|uniref:Ribosomal protein S18 acetylase RimI-like enzyme n=1 Tax=Paraburkholderia caledonica TaxID=134536 RepID=A0AB73IN97_9BURK|nr:ribosomal protein S18 acetylase RimI-like enzyme [Paraburkholderia caledonica]